LGRLIALIRRFYFQSLILKTTGTNSINSYLIQTFAVQSYLCLMKTILIIIFCLRSVLSFAQKEIKIDDAKNHVGDTVKICTKIYGGKFLEKDTLTLLNAGGYYPDAPLTIIIRAEALRQFNNPVLYYKDRNICVTGKVELFKNKPQIVITTKSQIVEQVKDH
jgi:hypothetical protein